MESERTTLTSQQESAIGTRDVSIALSAGAGCGKTFVLTRRFLDQLRPHSTSPSKDTTTQTSRRDPLGGIVAITFTERAAREMRDRIRSACRDELRNCPPEEVAHWSQILRALDSARITTIHSFCGALLRSHAVDAGIDPNFGMLDAASTDSLLRQVVSDAVHQLLIDENEECMRLVLHYGLERTNDLLRRLMIGRFEVDLDRFSGVTPDGLADTWFERWNTEFAPALLAEFVDSPLTRELISLLQQNEPSHAEMQKRRSFLLENIPRLSQADDLPLLLAELLESAKIQGGGGKKAWTSEDVYERMKDTLANFRKHAKRVADDLTVDPAQLETAAEFGLSALNVIRDVGERYRMRKQESGMLDFDDLLLQTRDLLRSSASVRRRAASGIETLMVDEFQDTDPVQSEIIRHLCGDRLLDGKLFLVGDAKQSIYRFRRADPRVFEKLRNEIPERGRLPLSTNFRSQPAILNFVNHLFSESMGESYEPLRPHRNEQLSPTPAIEFLFASSDSVSGDTKEGAESKREREADWIARRLSEFLRQETPCIRTEDTETGGMGLRPAVAGDVAILFRTMSHVAIYEEALRKYGIDYYLVRGRSFYAQQEVYDLVNLCQYLDDVDDHISLLGILRSPFFSLTDDTIYAMSATAGSLAAALDVAPPGNLPEQQKRQLQYAARVLAELRAKKDRLPLASLLNLAVERTGYDAALLGEYLGRRKLANLKKLIEMARQFDHSGLSTMSDFVSRLRDSVAEQSDEEMAATQSESGNVVRLMTIHQSKGLEFPVVVVADMDWIRRGGSTSTQFHPEFGPLLSLPTLHGQTTSNLAMKMHRLQEEPADLAETLRLFYVAATRAADYLILSAGLDTDRQIASPWLTLLSQRFDLHTGAARFDSDKNLSPLIGEPGSEVPEIKVHLVAPEASPAESTQKKSLLPFSEFREAVAGAAPAELPATLTRIPATAQSRRYFTVSQIEDADAELKSGRALPPAAKQTRSDDTTFTGLENAAAAGTVLHGVLERMEFRHPEAVERLLDRCIANERVADVASLRDELSPKLQAFLESPVCSEIASADQCFREIDFLLRWPLRSPDEDATTISGQIDCLFRGGSGQWHIVDYKTGYSFSQDADIVVRKYEIQLTLYALAARELIGRWPDTVELVLLGDKAVRRIAFDIDEQRNAAMIERIHSAIDQMRDPLTASDGTVN